MLFKSLRNRKPINMQTRKKATVEDVNNIGVQYFGKRETREEFLKHNPEIKTREQYLDAYPPAVKRTKKR